MAPETSPRPVPRPVPKPGEAFDFRDFLTGLEFPEGAEAVLASLRAGEIAPLLAVADVAAVLLLPGVQVFWNRRRRARPCRWRRLGRRGGG